MPTPTAIDLANKYRAQLAAQEADAVERMGRIYSRIYSSLIGEINDLADEIYALGPKAKKEQILKLGRLQRILGQVKDEAGKFGTVVQGEVDNIRLQAIQAGVDNAIGLIDASLPPLTPELRKQVLTSLTRLPTDAIEAASGMFGKDSPLIAKLQDDFGIAVADQVEMHIVDGIALGMNPRTIAAALSRNLQADLGTGLGWVLTTVRTAQIKSYQTANHATYLANSRIVPEWTWVAALDDRTCMSCVAMHGTVHPVTETLNDHHNGRCLISGETVKTKRGNIKIEDVMIGDFVLTHSGKYRKVLSTSKREYSGVVYNVNGLTTTPEHPFLTQRGWVEAKDLIASDTLFTLKSIESLDPTVKCKLDKYCGYVYNLQVDTDESFIANGIVVHNCAPLPKTISYKDLGINLPDPVGTFPQGEKWFKAQPQSVQRKMMGPGKFEAYQSGKFKFADLSAPYQDDVYGELLREATLKELLKRV